MPTYVYETIPADGGKPQRFEVRQSMTEKPLTQHPDSGVPVRRVVIGGTGVMGSASAASSTAGGSCGVSCGCHG